MLRPWISLTFPDHVKANYDGWKGSEKDPAKNTGIGGKGSCCTEMDVWEANSMSAALTPHTCKAPSVLQQQCSGDSCGKCLIVRLCNVDDLITSLI
jgi:hypothetical protein